MSGSMKPYKWFSGTSGWIHELLAKLPKDMQTKIRSWALFRPDDINDLYPFPRNRISYPGVERIKGYRYPAPGSRPKVNVPQSESDDKLYDIKYFDHDTRRRPAEVFSWSPDFKRVALPDSPEPAKLMGSPGNKNPAVLAYDPTGLRSAMSATNQELEKALDRAMPNHNVRYAWQAEEEQIVKDCEAKGLPVPPGKRAKFAVPAMATQRRW
ncbi:hypothetical protein NSK_007963 [Nannochloropsis salina CCMP1776]|uniref:Uncharacterized protein n=1 Tax=Nannochloropsis salina CCMP1776 TaxID=1027361 RepID=A0A4D9CPW6_9STRA|nr:hypothetical protein NSK_007963 [Nannochloropsis salina CCMP1776]|eukprot:TFJ80786.1 hypothetical protein NSK_007963 [Nannochloropsis salina CCMP1776]